jgi:hypothetical protein
LINDMPELTAVQRAELEALGPENVQLKLMYAGAARGADVPGFRCGNITRGTIENWLVEQAAIEAHREQATLSWAKFDIKSCVVVIVRRAKRHSLRAQ